MPILHLQFVGAENLELHGDHITDAAVAFRKRCEDSKSSALNRTRISDEGVAALKGEVPGHPDYWRKCRG